jgi:hypothetical protein
MEERIQALEVKNKAKDLLTLNLQEKVYPAIFGCLLPLNYSRDHLFLCII